jgi:hypothetical protein
MSSEVLVCAKQSEKQMNWDLSLHNNIVTAHPSSHVKTGLIGVSLCSIRQLNLELSEVVIVLFRVHVTYRLD